MAGQDWARLAHYVIRARVKAGYQTRQAFARAIGVTATTLGVLERDHRSVSDNTLAAIEEKLGWAPGSAAAVLAGGEPDPEQAPDPDTADTAERRELLRRRAELRSMQDIIARQLAEVEGELRDARRTV